MPPIVVDRVRTWVKVVKIQGSEGTLEVMKRAELARLCRCAVARPRWQLVFAAALSVWTFAWITGQIITPGTTPLGVLSWTGLPLDAATEWARGRAGVLIWFATAGGLCWAATTERAQFPALAGWTAVLVAGEAAGYQQTVQRALISMAGFMIVLALLSITGRRTFVVDRIAIIPKDVLRAATTAATLSAVVPLIAPGLAVARLVRPYVTKPPRPDPSRPGIPAARASSESDLLAA